MKWYSDLSVGVTYDVSRDQMQRVIENVLCFQDGGQFVENPCFSLVAPGLFAPQGPRRRSRLYQYKFRSYTAGGEPNRLSADLDACPLPLRTEYPNAQQLEIQLKNLTIHFVSFDDLFRGLPESPIHEAVWAFWEARGTYQGRPPVA
jgi:hypothetical protein